MPRKEIRKVKTTINLFCLKVLRYYKFPFILKLFLENPRLRGAFKFKIADNWTFAPTWRFNILRSSRKTLTN